MFALIHLRRLQLFAKRLKHWYLGRLSMSLALNFAKSKVVHVCSHTHVIFGSWFQLQVFNACWQQSDSYRISWSLTTSIFDSELVEEPLMFLDHLGGLLPGRGYRWWHSFGWWGFQQPPGTSSTTSFKSSSTRTRTSGAFMVLISCLSSPMLVSRSCAVTCSTTILKPVGKVLWDSKINKGNIHEIVSVGISTLLCY